MTDIKDRHIAELQLQRNNAMDLTAQACARFTECHQAMQEAQEALQEKQAQLTAALAVNEDLRGLLAGMKPAPETVE